MLASFMAVFDISIVFVALPDIERSIGAGLADQQWIASAYGLMEAGFTLAAGTLGDLLGRRRVHIAGVVLFMCASVASGLAPTPAGLIAARFVQGVGGAIMMVLPLAMLAAMARDDRERESSIRLFGTVAGFGGIVAPAIGGALVQAFGWRSVFFVNVPVALFVLYAAVLRTPGTPPAPNCRLDVGGQSASILGLVALSFAAIEGSDLGWTSAPILGAAAIAIAAAAAFVVIEQRSAFPMIRFAELRRATLAAGAGCMFVMNAGFFTIYLLSTLFLQNVKGVSPFLTGWYLLANNLAFFIANVSSGPLVRRIGGWNAGLAGMACGAVAIAMFATFDTATPGALLVIPLLLAGFGWGFAVTPLNALAMNDAPAGETGLDSGLLNLGRPLGAVVATAAFGSVIAGAIGAAVAAILAPLHLSASVVSGIAAEFYQSGTGIVPHAEAAGISQAALRAAVDTGFVLGMHRTAVVAAAVSAFALAAAWIAMRRTEGSGGTTRGNPVA